MTAPARKPQLTFSLEQIQEAAEEYCGFCLACGEEASGIEPDAVGYRCEACGRPEVHGAEQIALMGLVT